MNKLLGHLSTMLLSPDVETAAPSAPAVTSTPGRSTGAAPAADNFYASSPVNDGKVTGSEVVEDFSGGESGNTEKQAGEDFVSLTPETTEQVDGAIAEKPVVETAAPQLLKLDPETIAALRATAPAQERQTSVPALSAQQLKEMLNPVEVTPELLTSMGFEGATPEQAAGFQNFANATVKNAVSITRHLISQARKEFEQALGPLMEHRQSQQIDQTRSEFYTQHKDLAKYEKIVKLVTLELGQDPKWGNATKDQIFAEVANRTRATLKGYGVQLSSPANPGAGSPSTKVPAPNKSGASGRSGGDTNGQRGKPNDADADIYNR